METYEPTPDEEAGAAQTGNVAYSDDAELTKEVTGLFIQKDEFLDNEQVIEITGLSKNKWGRDVLSCILDDEERTVNINKENKNSLIDMFGTKLKDWKGKKVKVRGESFTGDEEKGIKDGVKLFFKKV